jgi:hypothetical protein
VLILNDLMIDLSLVNSLPKGIRKYFQFTFAGPGVINCRTLSRLGEEEEFPYEQQSTQMNNQFRDNEKTVTVPHCKCEKSSCSTNRCSCRKANALCNSHCKCIDCLNTT